MSEYKYKYINIKWRYNGFSLSCDLARPGDQKFM